MAALSTTPPRMRKSTLRRFLLRASACACAAACSTSGSILDMGRFPDWLRIRVAATERADQRDVERQRAGMEVGLRAQAREQRLLGAQHVEIGGEPAAVAVALQVP